MSFQVRCIKHLAKDRKWVLESGRVYEANKTNENEVDIINHYGEVITLNLKDFKIYCIMI